MSLTYFTARSTYVAFAFEWGEVGKSHLMVGNLLGMSKWTEDKCLWKKITTVGLSAKFIGIYPRSQVNVYRTIGPLV